ncbi:Phospholipid scramblase 1 [Tyrophagus putrescentiae]|nr:Phospholipid scramblase 1 [Tyrophagus putrescentiae]
MAYPGYPPLDSLSGSKHGSTTAAWLSDESDEYPFQVVMVQARLRLASLRLKECPDIRLVSHPVVTAYPPPGQPPVQFMQAPAGYAGDPNVPPGLEYLTMIDQLLVKQKVELLEAFTGFETNNKYSIKNSMGQHVYYAVEENDFCTRNCLGASRPFEMIIMDNSRNEIMRIHRPFRFDSCCCPCFLQEIEVYSVNGQLLGSVSQDWSIFCPKFTIKDASGESVLKVEGPFCTYSICGDVEFQVLSLDKETKVGKITKQWTGLAREMFTDADYFGVTFPLDLSVHIKAVLLAATFLIDFMFFEKSGNKENDRIGML